MSLRAPLSRRWAFEARPEAGQAAVETALTLPMMVFAALGILQLTLAYHARILTEYAAFKAARAGSVYRADCTRMQRAALMALIPSMPVIQGNNPLESQFVTTARQVATGPTGFNRSHHRTPLVFVDYKIENLKDRPFDTLLEPGATDVMRIRVKLAYFFEYRIPFVNEIMTRYWLAVHTGKAWAQGVDPTLVARDAVTPTGPGFSSDELVTQSMLSMARGYFTTPIVSSWSMRMMSDTMPNERGDGQCR